ncbi:MAG: hypothetical protein JST35_08920 [Armatimonadetes bacterium]|nr:hypothetical protein [Armatimonadota bacterium]
MKRTLIAALVVLATLGHAQTQSPAGPPKTVTISAKGTDVKTILGDLFTQAKKNYVIAPGTYMALHLSLSDVEFDEALQIICTTAKLKFEVQNGIYYISIQKPLIAPAPPTNDSTPKLLPSTVETKVTPVPTQSTNPPSIKTAKEALTKKVSVRFAKVDIHTLMKVLGRQAGVEIEVLPTVPLYKLDARLSQLTLEKALTQITTAANLEFVATEKGTIEIRLKKALDPSLD